jgi:K+-sensing histidine kinase KdpD
MSFIDWFKLGQNKNKDVKVVKVKEKSIAPGAMASGSPAAAAQAMAQMLDQKKMPAKILMVQDGIHSPQVTDYALKMAQRLDCEIIALDVTVAPLQFAGDKQEYEIQRFYEQAEKGAEAFELQAQAMGITVRHVMEVDDPEKIIAELSQKDAGIRYVLTKPDQEVLDANEERIQVPVFDLNCSRL